MSKTQNLANLALNKKAAEYDTISSQAKEGNELFDHREEMSADEHKELTIFSSEGSFLADSVFIPSTSQTVQESSKAPGGDMPLSVSEVVDRSLSFHQALMDSERRESLEKEVIKTIQELDEVRPQGTQYLMSNNADDSVDIQEVDGKYNITPGKNFTGIIEISRKVNDGEEPSFDVLEFKDGILVSGIEGSKGESKIQNMNTLKEKMISELEGPLFFVFGKEEDRERILDKIQQQTSKAGKIVEEEQDSGFDYQKYESRKFADAVQSVVSDNVSAKRKTGVWNWSLPGIHSAEYHREQKAVVDAITASVTNKFKLNGVPENVLEKYKDRILGALYTEVQKKEAEIRDILSDKKSLGSPEYVKQRVADTEISDNISRAIWDSCKKDLARDVLRETMISQMKVAIPPQASSFRTYTQYRDKLIEHIVDESMKALPTTLTADLILNNKNHFLKEFERIYSTHEAPIKGFLEAHKKTWFGAGEDVSTASRHSISIVDKVAQGVVAVADESRKEEALDIMMKDISAMLRESKDGGIPASTWLTREWYPQQRNAIVDQLVEDIKQKLLKDRAITAEMLYNNRAGIIEAVRSEVIVQKGALKTFLDKPENRTPELGEIKSRFQRQCASVTDGLVGRISRKLQENVSVKSEEDRVLSDLAKEMAKYVKEKVKPARNTSTLSWSKEYSVERDVMAEEIAKKACEQFAGQSYGALKTGYPSIMESFKSSVDRNIEGIETKLKSMAEAGVNTGAKAVDAIHRRTDEAKDVNLAADIATKFAASVTATITASKVHVPAIDLSSVKAGAISSPGQTPKSIHSGSRTGQNVM